MNSPNLPAGTQSRLWIILIGALACLPLQQTRADEIEDFQKAAAAASSGDRRTAVEGYEAILKKNPKARETSRQLAWILATCPDPAIRDGKRAVGLAEKLPQLSQEVASDGRKLVYLQILGHKAPDNNQILAAAHAEAGDFRKAILVQKKCLKASEESLKNEEKKAKREKKGNNNGATDPLKPIKERLALFEAHRPYHTPK
jgi:tetratricopeptide (TPR) repeat protein